MFGKKKPVNQSQVDEMVVVLKQAASTADRGEQDVALERLDVMIDQLDNKPTLQAYRATTPELLVRAEARHLASVTGDPLSSCEAKVRSLLTDFYGKGKSYDVLWWPYSSAVLSDIRVHSDRYLASL